MPHKCPVAQRAWRSGYMKRRRLEKGGVLRAQERARSAEIKEFLRTYKTSVGCQDCGYDAHHAALEFDHVVGDKAFNVAHAKSIAQARAEIQKCEVVCSNCHRIRTFERYRRKPDIFAATYEAVPDGE